MRARCFGISVNRRRDPNRDTVLPLLFKFFDVFVENSIELGGRFFGCVTVRRSRHFAGNMRHSVVDQQEEPLPPGGRGKIDLLLARLIGAQ